MLNMEQSEIWCNAYVAIVDIYVFLWPRKVTHAYGWKMSEYMEQSVWFDWRTVYAPREGIVGVYPINTIITLEWAYKQFQTRVHTLFYFLHGLTWSVYIVVIR